MDNERKHCDGADYDKVVGMLSPRFSREMTGRIVNFEKPRRTWIWTVGSVAAMLALILFVAVRVSMPAAASSVPASEIIIRALETVAVTGGCTVNFTCRGAETSDDEVYVPRPDAPWVGGTLYILCGQSGEAGCRIDWHDSDRNSVVYDGADYIRLKDGKEVERHPSRFIGLELRDLLDIGSATRIVGEIPAGEITEKDGVITVSHEKTGGGVIIRGEFSRENGLLIKASVVMTADDGRSVTVMETSSVIFGADIPRSLFLR